MINDMEDRKLETLLCKLPRVIKYKDGEEIVDCTLGLYFNKEFYPNNGWTVGYYCREYDYFAMCGHGSTACKAVEHLIRVYKDFVKSKNEGYVRQINK